MLQVLTLAAGREEVFSAGSAPAWSRPRPRPRPVSRPRPRPRPARYNCWITGAGYFDKSLEFFFSFIVENIY